MIFYVIWKDSVDMSKSGCESIIVMERKNTFSHSLPQIKSQKAILQISWES